MKKIIEVILVISLLSISCGDETIVDTPVDDGISWEQVTGKLAYLKENVIYLIDADSLSVKKLGTTILTNLKWNKTLQKITGIRFINDSSYSLEGIALDGNNSILNNTLTTKYYDWLPDGRLVTISKEGQIFIDDTKLFVQPFNPVFGIACSPDGNKIVISTENVIENLLLEIDINSFSQKIVDRNSNILEPNFLQPLYSSESDRVLYVSFATQITLFDGTYKYYRVWSSPRIELGPGKEPSRSYNLERILYTKVTASRASIIGIYSMDITDGNSVEIISKGHTPIWIY